MECSDIELIDKIKKDNCNVSLIKLIERHTPLCYDIYKKYAPTITSSGLCLNELCKEKDSVLWKAAVSYNPEKKVKFSTWLGNNIRFQCLNAINNNGQYLLLDDTELQKQIDKQGGDMPVFNESSTLDYILGILDKLKDKRAKKIFILRYMEPEGDKMTWAEIAEKLGISTQTAINIHEKARKFLKHKLESKHCYDLI